MLEDDAEALADNVLVVGDEYLDHGVGWRYGMSEVDVLCVGNRRLL